MITEYMAASGLVSACVVAAFLMASRDYPRGPLKRVALFSLAAVTASASPMLAWRFAGFARPTYEASLPSDFKLLAETEANGLVYVWAVVGGEPMAYSLSVVGKSLHDELQRAGKSLRDGGAVRMTRANRGKSTAGVDEVVLPGGDSEWRAREQEPVKKD